MSKAYWIAVYRSVRDPQALAAYAKLALPALAGLSSCYFHSARRTAILLRTFGPAPGSISPDPH